MPRRAQGRPARRGIAESQRIPFASYPQPSTAAPFLYEGTPATSSDSFAAAPLLPYTLTFSQDEVASGGVGHFTFNLIVTNLGVPGP